MTKRKPPCVHHWMLSDAVIGDVRGKCTKCRRVRMFTPFANNLEERKKNIRVNNKMKNYGE